MSLEKENFDGLLKKARWPEVSAESKERLEEFWGETWRRQPRWRWVPLAAAALVVVGIARGILNSMHRDLDKKVVAVVDPDETFSGSVQVLTVKLEGRP